MKILRHIFSLIIAAGLMLNHATAGGLDVSVAPAAPYHPGYVSGRYYTLMPALGSSTLLLTENRLYLLPFYTPTAMAIDRIALNVTTGAGDAQAQLRCGIYNDALGVPTSIVLDAGLISNGTGTGDKQATVSLTLPPGWYWVAFISNRNSGATGVQPTVRSGANENRDVINQFYGMASADYSATSGQISYNDQTVASWAAYVLPTTAPALTYGVGSAVPIFTVRAL